MSVHEATLQLELVGHDFFVFTNAESNRTNVVYRRNDGHYGLIESRPKTEAGRGNFRGVAEGTPELRPEEERFRGVRRGDTTQNRKL